MGGSAIKSTNYAARLAMPLIHVGDRQESLEEWKPAPFSYTVQYASLSLLCGPFVVLSILMVWACVKGEG